MAVRLRIENAEIVAVNTEAMVFESFHATLSTAWTCFEVRDPISVQHFFLLRESSVFVSPQLLFQ
jgi:hypothetical protein